VADLTAPSLTDPNLIPHLGLAHLMRRNFAGERLDGLCQRLIQQAQDNPDDAAALLDASVILQLYGNDDLALQLQTEALKVQRHFYLPSTRPTRLRLLALLAPGNLMANAPIDCLLEDSDVELHRYYITDAQDDLSTLPPHDVLFVAVCETEANRAILDALQERLREWPKPVLNVPQHIPHVARDTAAALLAPIPGVCMPPTLRLPWGALLALSDTQQGPIHAHTLGIAYPLIVRPVDSHAGNDLHKVDDPAALAAVLQAFPCDDAFVSPFIDYSGSDGQFRKYRVMLIDGRPYVAHGAISSHWMIHYLNAGMADDAAKRAEEADFMARFDEGFARRHADALQAINRAIGLDYLGIDCAEMPDGRLLVFEVDHAMVVHAMDPVDVYPYKPATMQRIFRAFRAMVFRAAGLPLPELE